MDSHTIGLRWSAANFKLSAAAAVMFVAILVILTGCTTRDVRHYKHEVLLPMTPVKDQGRSQLCWAYAMLATIETEHIQRGDSVNLSAKYIGRMLPEYQRALLKDSSPQHGKKDTSSQRAMCQTLLNMIGRYGVVGYDVLPDDATDDLPTPQLVFMLGARYTPQEFAHSLCAPDEYVGLTCQEDSPYYKKVEVVVPDNWEHNRLLNIPLDTLRRCVPAALKKGHPVCWESKGHAMCIVGLARDDNGKAYYVMKNSRGEDDDYGGLVYMSARKMWHDMVALYMTREAFEAASAPTRQ